MSFEFAVYDADQITILAFGVQISKGAGASGYADGIFLEIDPDSPSFTKKTGTDGSVTRSKTNNRCFVAKVHLMQSSDSNAVFSQMLALDEAQPNGAGVGSFVVSDNQGTTVFQANQAWVAGLPAQPFDREASERTWEIHGIRKQAVVGGNGL